MKKIHFLLLISLSILLSSCGGDDNAKLNLVFKLNYDGDPLVMFQDLEYPNGETMQVKRVSFYLSDINVRDEAGITTKVSEVEYVDLTDSHIDMNSAVNGYSLDLGELDIEDYNRVSFTIGLSDEQNAGVPEDYSSDNPLSKSGDYWRSWNSYIYVKIEGHMDYNKNGVTDSGEAFALHLGTNEVKREFSSDVDKAEDAVNINIDVRKIFENNQGIYDIAEGSRLHNLDAETLANMDFLANGLIGSMSAD